MIVEEQIPLLEEILTEWKGTIGNEYEGYKNHVYRMINFCFALEATTKGKALKRELAIKSLSRKAKKALIQSVKPSFIIQR